MGGQAFSKIRGSFITRPIQRFNIEARTEKLLSKDKPKPSPQYQSDKELLESIRQDRPEIVEAATKKDDHLLVRLKDVYVASSDPDDFDPDSNRKLPQNPERPLPGKGIRGSPGSGFAEASQLMTSTKQKKLALDEIQSLLDKFPQTVTLESNIIKDLSEKLGISAEKLLHLHTYYRVFAYQPKVVVEETLVHDPHKAQSSWQSADESELNQKHVPLSPNIKTLPRSSPG